MPALPAIGAFALKHIGWIVGGLGCLNHGIMLHHSQGQTRAANDRSAAWEKLFHAEQSAFRETVANVRRVTAQAQADDAAHALKVERDQANRTQEVSSEYQARLADLRSRYDALRLRTGAPEIRLGNPGGSAAAPVPGLPNPAGRPDAAPAPGDLQFNAEANAIQLEELQRWVRDQAGVPR
jgi:hypothetical protein